MIKSLLSISLMLALLSGFAQTVTYDINSSGFINLIGTGVCTPTDVKPPNTGDTWGLQWTSTGTNMPSSVQIQFYQTYQSGAAGQSFPTELNGMLDSIWTTFDYTCTGFLQTFTLNEANYNPGGLNQFTVDYSFTGNCLIDENTPDWPTGVYGRVTVDYTPASNVSELDQLLIDLYPNPANNLLSIKCAHPIDKVEIMDNAGRVVLTRNTPQKTLDISSLSNGFYTVLVTSDKVIGKKQLLKN